MNEDSISWLDLGPTSAIPPRGARQVVTPWGDIAVFRAADDRYYALEDRCPHAGGPLSQGIVHGAAVTCPLHNWVIGLDTGEVQGPDPGCVKRYPLRVVDGHLHIGFVADNEAAA